MYVLDVWMCVNVCLLYACMYVHQPLTKDNFTPPMMSFADDDEWCCMAPIAQHLAGLWICFTELDLLKKESSQGSRHEGGGLALE